MKPFLRVVLGALLLEVILFAVLVPIGFVNTTLFLVAVPIGAFVFAYLVTWWMLRKQMSGLLLQGALLGVIATAIYFALVLIPAGGWNSAMATYGLPLFVFCQLMRIAGCITAAVRLQRRVARVQPVTVA